MNGFQLRIVARIRWNTWLFIIGRHPTAIERTPIEEHKRGDPYFTVYDPERNGP